MIRPSLLHTFYDDAFCDNNKPFPPAGNSFFKKETFTLTVLLSSLLPRGSPMMFMATRATWGSNRNTCRRRAAITFVTATNRRPRTEARPGEGLPSEQGCQEALL